MQYLEEKGKFVLHGEKGERGRMHLTAYVNIGSMYVGIRFIDIFQGIHGSTVPSTVDIIPWTASQCGPFGTNDNTDIFIMFGGDCSIDIVDSGRNMISMWHDRLIESTYLQ